MLINTRNTLIRLEEEMEGLITRLEQVETLARKTEVKYRAKASGCVISGLVQRVSNSHGSVLNRPRLLKRN